MCALISCPFMYSSMRRSGWLTTRDPTTKKVDLMLFVSKKSRSCLYHMSQNALVGWLDRVRTGLHRLVSKRRKAGKVERTIIARTVIETDTPGELVRAGGNICVTSVATASPPATVCGVGGSSRAERTVTFGGGVQGRYVPSIKLLQPLLDQGRVGGCNLVERRPVRG